MNFNFNLCELNDLKYLDDNKVTHVLSLVREGKSTNETVELLKDKNINHHIENFDDVDSLDKQWYDSDKEKNVKLTFPDKRHIMNIIEWLSSSFDNSKDNLIIHCQAGISRSPAMMFGILVYFSDRSKESILEAFKKVTLNRPFHYMNTLILKNWDDIMDTNLVILQKKWENFISDSRIYTMEIVSEKVNEFIIKESNR